MKKFTITLMAVVFLSLVIQYAEAIRTVGVGLSVALGDLAALTGRGYILRGGVAGAIEEVDCSAAGALGVGDGTDFTCDTTPTLVGVLTADQDAGADHVAITTSGTGVDAAVLDIAAGYSLSAAGGLNAALLYTSAGAQVAFLASDSATWLTDGGGILQMGTKANPQAGDVGANLTTLGYADTDNTLGTTVRTGDQTGASGNTGNLVLQTGNSTNGNSGNITIQSGTAGTTRGDITMNAANVSVTATILDIAGNFKWTGGTAYTDEPDDGNSGTTDTIDWTTGNNHKSTLTGDVTYTFTDPAGPAHLTFKLIQDATGTRLATWPAAVKWEGGTAPTLTTTASAVDFAFFYFDGTNYYGSFLLDVK